MVQGIRVAWMMIALWGGPFGEIEREVERYPIANISLWGNTAFFGLKPDLHPLLALRFLDWSPLPLLSTFRSKPPLKVEYNPHKCEKSCETISINRA